MDLGLYLQAAPGLRSVEQLIQCELSSATGIPEACRSLVLGGKRLRARLLLNCVRDPHRDSDAAVRTAAAIELFHAASLVHDDIVDHCTSRRGLRSVHETAGVRSAALGGLYVIHMALSILGDLPSELRSRFAEAGRRLSHGQFLEILHAYDTDLLPETRFEIMDAKTASVFALATELGAMMNGDTPSDCATRRSFGAALGMVFQIADDVDDLFAPASVLGRDPGSDLQRGVISLPMAFALQTAGRKAIASAIDAASASEHRSFGVFTAALHRTGALERTREVAAGYARDAHAHLDRLPTAPGTTWMRFLVNHSLGRIERHLDARTV